jgi:hypothetical protein
MINRSVLSIERDLGAGGGFFISGSASGVPAGGDAGQILAKQSNNNYDTYWVDPQVPVVASTEFLLQTAYNGSGTTINKGEVVYIAGAEGSTILVGKAIANSIHDSEVIGVALEDILNSGYGSIVIHGIIDGINTDSFSEGDRLYLSSTNYGQITNIEPSAPNHSVLIGHCVKKDAIDGAIYVDVNTGEHLNSLHDVSINLPSSGDFLFFDNDGIWKNKKIDYSNISGLSDALSGFYPASNPSGFITGVENVVYTTGSQNISGIKTFIDESTIFNNVSGVSGVFQNIQADNVVYSKTDSCIVAQNGDDIIAKYNEAKALTPNGAVKSNTNRATLIIMPGIYDLSANLDVDTQFVDIVGLGSVKLDVGCVPAVTFAGNTINITANNIHVKGISVGTQSFKVSSGLNFLILEDCLGGDYSFCTGGGGESVVLSSTLVNCKAGNNSFGVGGLDIGGGAGSATIAGDLTNCIAGDGSFAVGGGNGHIWSGGTGTISGILTNCISGVNSFAVGTNGSDGGSGGGTISGTLTNCIAWDGSFAIAGSSAYANGGDGTVSGVLTDCKAGNNSFGIGGYGPGGGTGIVSGTLIDCSGGNNCFGIAGGGNPDINGSGGSGVVSGTLTNCKAGDNSFGIGGDSTKSFGQSAGVVSGTLTSCVAGAGSFGVGYDGYEQPTGSGSVISGKLYFTRLTAGTFGTVSGIGLMRMCIDGNNDIIDQG